MCEQSWVRCVLGWSGHLRSERLQEGELERWLSHYEHSLFFQKTGVWFPVSMSDLTTIYNSNSKGAKAHAWYTDMHSGKTSLHIKYFKAKLDWKVREEHSSTIQQKWVVEMGRTLACWSNFKNRDKERVQSVRLGGRGGLPGGQVYNEQVWKWMLKSFGRFRWRRHQHLWRNGVEAQTSCSRGSFQEGILRYK